MDAPPAPPRPPLTHRLMAFAHEVVFVYWALLKVMVPALLIVKALEQVGGDKILATWLAPLMALVGLPDTLGLVWAATLLSNIYAGLAVFFTLAADTPVTVAQATVLGSLMLVAHSLPVEGAIAKAAGVSWRATVLIRLGGAIALGALLNLIYRGTGSLEQPITLPWQPPPAADSLAGWALDQLHTLGWILVIITVLMSTLRLLRHLGIERLIHALLTPALRLIGIRGEAANITVIGVTLGLTFGAGLLLKEVRSGTLSRRDVFLTLSFLSLSHSLIEDTLLVLLMGADLSGILWGRLLFALLAIRLLSRLPLNGLARAG
ncbi:hypothetical protein [Denitromonas iodatirespirans]|uniref:Nucleoside recognition protein n=1 Tax=Denitromonas iodatirespirans TaxID=2795389 RepID=A0A944D6X5_DENI1|nr:hypothetical protein [Denitromonas iodatirespirans]MBT0959626.1 hypothetical protein [Denitromonas iodatirespirans]